MGATHELDGLHTAIGGWLHTATVGTRTLLPVVVSYGCPGALKVDR